MAFESSRQASIDSAVVHKDEARKTRRELVDFPVFFLSSYLLALVDTRSPVQHRGLLAALRAKDAPDAMAIAPPRVELKLKQALSAFEGMDKDAFSLLLSNQV
ncbi:MAG TPA: hypothetical protein VJB57_09960 [Dehalococcoidia bacterium]|nr:hypothetical protein [Dehalococcoidia bacterium]